MNITSAITTSVPASVQGIQARNLISIWLRQNQRLQNGHRRHASATEVS